MSNEIPKFNLSGAKIKTDAELDAKLAEKGGAGQQEKYLRPGIHDVVISGVEYTGKASDDNWGKFKLTLVGGGTKEVQTTLLVPLKDVEYRTSSGGTTMFLYQKFQKFMAAIGVKVTVSTLEDTLNNYFANTKALINLPVTINLNYQGNHIAYKGKSEIGEKMYVIQMADKSVLTDSAGKTLTFPDFDAAMGHVESNQITVDRYPSVLEFSKSAGLKSVTKTASNW